MNKINKITAFIGLGFLLLGLLLGWLFFGGTAGAPVEQEEISLAEADQEHDHAEDGIWTCAMHPQIRQDGPGQCPICAMDLIPVSTTEAVVDDIEIQMTEAAAKIADIQTFTVAAAEPVKEIYLPGKVKADERRIAAVTARFPGRIEKLYVNFTGQEVKKGERLASIYSPELVQAQKELLEAARFRDTNPSFFEAAQNKLRLWNLNQAQIQQILESGQVQYNFDIYAGQSGTVVSKNVNEGDYVNEGQSLFEVANLAEVWVLFDAYEDDLPWIDVGDEIRFTVSSLPGKVFSSEVSFIDPVINPQTRVASVRTELQNPNGQLKPGMFAQGMLESRLEDIENALTIPKSAVLWTGKRAVVYVKDPAFEQPTFEYREVVLGPEAGAYYVVNEGLRAGEEVVANGVFKVDAAAQLQGKVSMMNPPAVPMAEHEAMPGMNIPPVQIRTEAYVEEKVPDFSDRVPEAFQAQLNRVVNAYLSLKEALVQSDEKAAARHNKALVAALEKVDAGLLSDGLIQFWKEKEIFITEHAHLGLKAESWEERRENFIYISHPLIKLVEAFGAEQTLYVDYCPMANHNEGAFWLSEQLEIRNPFMPETMLSCGEVRDTIKNE